MHKFTRIICFISLVFICFSCANNQKNTSLHELKNQLKNQINEIEGDVAVAYINLSNPNEVLFINADEKFHAASTMKVPVMIELYKQAAQQKFSLQDAIVLKNEFKSIVDGSLYKMDVGDDSDDIIYSKINTPITLYDLMYSMITVSSNLATNVLIEVVDAKKVTESMRLLGAKNIEVLRGVEDQKAYDLGLSNSTTARDMAIIMKSIATYNAGTKENCEQMIHILKAQKFNDMIPKFLPKDVLVAHKTGSITGVHHDTAIVYLPDGKSYVLILLSKNLKDFDLGTHQLATISKSVYYYMNQ